MEKPSYTMRELFKELPISLKRLGERAGVSEVTIARIRDGKPARRSTLNRLLREMAKGDVLDRPLSLDNITGVNILGETQPEEEDAEKPFLAKAS